ncbi:MAG TPA: ceramide glucosyltransferase [Aestuariivirgaceae bacterium]
MLAILIGFSIFATLAHIASIALVAKRFRNGQADGKCPYMPPVTIIRPISGLYSCLPETLETTFQLTYPRFEIILCAARETDPAVAIARQLIARYPCVDAKLLIGELRFSQNPKLNNCIKGWEAARHDLVALVDCNVLLPGNYVEQMLASWTPEVGLISSPPIGSKPASFWAEVECSFLNTYQGRWLLFADWLGIAYAHGKNLMMRKSMLADAGGIRALAVEPAEDAAATKLMRRAGFRIALSQQPHCQPLGARTAFQVWDRQVRWAKLRRATFPMTFLPEIFSGSLLPLCASGVSAALAGLDAMFVVATHAGFWFAAEILLARRAGWPLSATTLASMITRDALIPPVWLAALASRSFEWGGHRMRTSPRLGAAD